MRAFAVILTTSALLGALAVIAAMAQPRVYTFVVNQGYVSPDPLPAALPGLVAAVASYAILTGLVLSARALSRG